MAAIKRRTTTVGSEIAIWILTPIVFLLIPALLIVFTPILLFRVMVVFLRNGFLGRDMGQILSPLSAVMAADDMYHQPKLSILYRLFLEGELDVEAVRQEFSDKAIQRRTAEGELKFPELRQYVDTWMGFYFWNQDQTFDIRNHVRMVKYEDFDETAVQVISNELMSKAWAKQRSPWELILIPNYRAEHNNTPWVPKTACILRFHHALADGLSIFKFIASDLGGVKLDTVQPNHSRKSLWRKIMDGLTFSFRLSYDVSAVIVKSNDPFWQFHLPEEQLSRTFNSVTSVKLPLSSFKEIREQSRANVAGILLAAFTGALRTLMLEQTGDVPDYISINCPVPIPGHPNQLRNHLLGTPAVNMGLIVVGHIVVGLKTWRGFRDSHSVCVSGFQCDEAIDREEARHSTENKSTDTTKVPRSKISTTKVSTLPGIQ